MDSHSTSAPISPGGEDMATASVDAATLLARLHALGAAAWVVGGQVRFRPLARIPAPLLAQCRAAAPALGLLLAAQPKRPPAPKPTADQRFMARVRSDLVAHLYASLVAARPMPNN